MHIVSSDCLFQKRFRNEKGQTKYFIDIYKYTFKINDYIFYAEDGMTWEEWVDSEYNTLDEESFDKEHLKFYGEDGGRISREPGIVYVKNDDFIIASEPYFTTWGSPTRT